MVFTEIKEKNGKRYYYRVISLRDGKKVRKRRVYLGSNLTKKELIRTEKEADRELGILNSLLTEDEMITLRSIKKEYSKQSKKNLGNRYETFISLFTYDSTGIEGNTLTLQECASLLFEDIVPPSKSLREINEVLGHRKAFDHILGYEKDITKQFILDLHRLVLKDTVDKRLEDQVGVYRSVQVFIRGLDWMPPTPDEVHQDMKELLTWYSKNRDKIEPLVVAVYFHVGFETIHPFIDGNGRVGRLLLNFILHKSGYPMVNIPNSEKLRYYEVLQDAQVNGNLRPFLEFMIELMKEGKVMF